VLKQKGDETSLDQPFLIAVPDPSLRPQYYRYVIISFFEHVENKITLFSESKIC
jgi:hypothetical protein